jgi:UDP-glucose 4-epimerase
VNTLALLACCEAAGVNQFVFSSTAAVYGEPPGGVCDEAMAPAPINPYGVSKLMSEWMLRDLSAVSDLRYVTLRYFNAAGADGRGRVGESTPHSTHLIKLACEVALGKRPSLTIFGTDYDTPDGTCLRDYIHVDDLASVHLAALAHLEAGGDSQVLNCGYGSGVSVRQVLDCVAAVSGVDFAVVEGGRRAGDPARLIAACARVRQVLDWAPRHDDLEEIVATALAWERKLERKRD